jgi:hypothetical protein
VAMVDLLPEPTIYIYFRELALAVEIVS